MADSRKRSRSASGEPEDEDNKRQKLSPSPSDKPASLGNCVICFDANDAKSMTLSCRHTLHARCVYRGLCRGLRQCPLCRQRIRSEDPERGSTIGCGGEEEEEGEEDAGIRRAQESPRHYSEGETIEEWDVVHSDREAGESEQESESEEFEGDSDDYWSESSNDESEDDSQESN
ncbi:hypothetical protein Dda_9371 [Drechslerella dactyloides]|uniref:RING-type domain-containing protein n=1 Tax=Drechslerella dactyloides TaxID=74499 RepID=A0AAD6IT37_DREDA|nr:hypothetical protein Dda_9371 [Drechslerella dactyloides]